MTNVRARLAFGVAVAIAALAVPVRAQDSEPASDEKIEGRSNPELLGEWSIKKEVRTLERSLEKYDPLIQSLSEANDDLKTDLQSFVNNPSDQVLGSRITLKMSAYAKKITWDFDRIISSQDVLLDVFKELQRKLQKFSGYLKFKEGDYESKVAEHKNKSKEMAQKLKDLSIAYKDAEDPATQEQTKREFTRLFREYKINERYVKGYSNNGKEYAVLAKNLATLVTIFESLQESFTQLIANLEMEKKFLMDNIRLQADSILVKKVIHETMSEGNLAIKTITEKLALLYTQVDGFAGINERLNEGLGRFAEGQEVLSEAMANLDRVGAVPGMANPSIENAIEYFYNKRIEEEDEEETE